MMLYCLTALRTARFAPVHHISVSSSDSGSYLTISAFRIPHISMISLRLSDCISPSQASVPGLFGMLFERLYFYDIQFLLSCFSICSNVCPSPRKRSSYRKRSDHPFSHDKTFNIERPSKQPCHLTKYTERFLPAQNIFFIRFFLRYFTVSIGSTTHSRSTALSSSKSR